MRGTWPTHAERNNQLTLADLLRPSVNSRLAGYEDLKDAARLSRDPTFPLIGSKKIRERGAALTSRLQSFETELLAEGGWRRVTSHDGNSPA